MVSFSGEVGGRPRRGCVVEIISLFQSERLLLDPFCSLALEESVVGFGGGYKRHQLDRRPNGRTDWVSFEDHALGRTRPPASGDGSFAHRISRTTLSILYENADVGSGWREGGAV